MSKRVMSTKFPSRRGPVKSIDSWGGAQYLNAFFLCPHCHRYIPKTGRDWHMAEKHPEVKKGEQVNP